MPGTVLSIIGVVPKRVGGVEMFARELSIQLGAAGWQSVFCFLGKPVDSVRDFLDLPGVTLEAGPAYEPPNRQANAHLRGLIRRYRPAILHLYFVDPLSMYPWTARWSGVRRIYLTDQISRPEGYVPVPPPAWKRALRQTLTLPLSGVISISDFNARCGEALGIVRPGRLHRIYNAVDLSRRLGDARSFRQKYAIPDDRRIVLQVSWIIPEKGVPDLLDAARIVISANPSAHFVLAGDGAQRQEYTDYAAGLGIADHVTFTGLIDDPLADGVFSAADVVCQLSRWQEAFGWTITEAMTCAKPLVASDVGGIPEIVVDSVTGFLVPRRDPAAAAARILQLLADESLRRRMGEAGRSRVEDRFNLKRTVADLVTLYGIRDRANTVS